MTLGPMGRWALASLVLIIVLLVYFSGAIVNAGNVGVVTTFGRVEEDVLYPGFHLVVPLAQRINQIDTRVQPHKFESIDAASQEMQTVTLTGMMNYHLEPGQASFLFQNVGLDFASKVIDPAFNDFIKEVVPQYPAIQILQSRDVIRTRARQKLGDNLSRYGIIVDDIYIANIQFSKDYQSAIEKKQTAQQNVETEQQVLAQKQVQAQQVLVDAKAQADAQVLKAQGEATSNQVRAASISAQLIDYLRWTRWDGKLPMVNGGANTLFQLPTP
ncbi:MAG: prohibitin family protein [Dehalococcoidia bacterium]|nr:prohibitin family protein [Dehalococcoidia bacterium]